MMTTNNDEGAVDNDTERLACVKEIWSAAKSEVVDQVFLLRLLGSRDAALREKTQENAKLRTKVTAIESLLGSADSVIECAERQGAESAEAALRFECVSPATVGSCQDTEDVTDEPKQHSSVRADDHEVWQRSPEDVKRARAFIRVWHLPQRIANNLANFRAAARAEGARASAERDKKLRDHVESVVALLNTDLSNGVVLTARDSLRRALLPPATPETKP